MIADVCNLQSVVGAEGLLKGQVPGFRIGIPEILWNVGIDLTDQCRRVGRDDSVVGNRYRNWRRETSLECRNGHAIGEDCGSEGRARRLIAVVGADWVVVRIRVIREWDIAH